MSNTRDRHDGGKPNHPGYDGKPDKQDVRDTIKQREGEEAKQDKDRVARQNEEVSDGSDIWFDSDYER